MVNWFTPDAQARIADAIATAEATTSGEIVCTCSAARHRYTEWILAVAAAIAFLLPFIAAVAGFGPARWIAAIGIWHPGPLDDRQTVIIYGIAQAVLLLAATLALWWSPFAQRFAPLQLRRDRVHEIALTQFLAKGIHLTRGRTGVLIHLSIEDHIVEVIADAAIYARVPPEHWQQTAQALLAGIARNEPTQGFVDAIGLAARVLAEHFPQVDDNPDELPNRLLFV